MPKVTQEGNAVHEQTAMKLSNWTDERIELLPLSLPTPPPPPLLHHLPRTFFMEEMS